LQAEIYSKREQISRLYKIFIIKSACFLGYSKDRDIGTGAGFLGKSGIRKRFILAAIGGGGRERWPD